jgi:hypothetical protein
VCDKKYVFNQVSADGHPLDAAAACPSLKSAQTAPVEAGNGVAPAKLS